MPASTKIARVECITIKDEVAALYQIYQENTPAALPFYKWHDTPECPAHPGCNICHGGAPRAPIAY